MSSFLATVALVLVTIIVALMWYLVGMLIVGIVNFFEGKPTSYEHWRTRKSDSYFMSYWGPVLIPCIALFFIIEICGYIRRKINIRKFFRNMKVSIPISIVTDWIIGGFRKPPIPPIAKDSDPSNLLTVSP